MGCASCVAFKRERTHQVITPRMVKNYIVQKELWLSVIWLYILTGIVLAVLTKAYEPLVIALLSKFNR